MTRFDALHLGLSVALIGLAALAPARADQSSVRIISVGGSVTEVVVALGAADRLIGRDTTSNYPESILALPDVGYVRALSPEGVLSLGPDLVIAEAGAGPAEAVAVLQAAGVPYIAIPESYDGAGVVTKIIAVAEALGVSAKGATLAATVEADLAKAAAQAASVTAPKRVLFVLSMEGGRIMAAGQNTSAEGILQLAGAENAASGFDGYKQMTDEAVLAAAPDVILMMDRDGDHAALNADLFAHPALITSPAAATQSVIRMDGMLLLGFGPRTAQAANDLHAALYGVKG